MAELYKAAGLIIRDRKLLITRTRGKDIFINPGGKLIGDETYQQSLVRELKEELGIETKESDMEKFGSWKAEAAYDPGVMLNLTAYLVKSFSGEIKPMSEVEELAWITSTNDSKHVLSSMLEHDILPYLKAKDLID